MSKYNQALKRTSNKFTNLLYSWLKISTSLQYREYHARLSKTGMFETLLGLILLGILSYLYKMITGEFPIFTNLTQTSINIWMIPLIVIIVYFVFNIILFFTMKAFGASGTFTKQCAMLSLIAVPMGVILCFFSIIFSLSGLAWHQILNPLSINGALGVFLVIFLIYGITMLLIGLQVVHDVNFVNSLYALGILCIFWALQKTIRVFINQQDTLTTRIWAFNCQQWQGGYMQEALLGHIWLVVFSVVIAMIIGVIIGVMISMPVQSLNIRHLVFLIPLVIFFIVWAVSSGVFGDEIASQINSNVRIWDRTLRKVGGIFGDFFIIIGAILRKPASVGIIGVVLTVTFFILSLVGEKASDLVLYLAGIILTIPSIALFGILIKPLGIGVFNAAFALILYAQLPILRNTYTGIKEIPPEIVEAGRGMGMTELQLLINVKLPLAMPVIMTGLRVSTVMLVGIAAIAAYIGTNTLGDYIFAGIQRAQEVRYITGAIVVAILALFVDYILGLIQKRLTPVQNNK